MNNPYAVFQTNPEYERNGVRMDYGDYWFQVARAGGANKRYTTRLQAVMKPYNRQIQMGTMDEGLAESLVRDVFASTILLGWGSKAHGEGQMIGPDGGSLPFNKENAVRLFTDLPELFADLRSRAQDIANFRAAEIEEDAKN